MISISGIPAFNDNYIWMIEGASRQVVLVDPGDSAPVLKALQADALQPVAILITHHHADHTGGITGLLAHYTLPVYGPTGEQIPHITQRLHQGDQVLIPELELAFQVMHTPGHTRGHLCYYGEGMLFCGDTLFTAGCGRLFEGTAQQMQHSLEKIRQLPDDTRIYCAHEYTLANLAFARIAEPDNPAILQRQKEAHRLRERGVPTVPSTLQLEKQTNPFLRWDNPELIAAAQAFSGHSLTTAAEIFGAVRHWKDTLD